MNIPSPDTRGLDAVFFLDEDAWAPTKALHFIVNAYLADFPDSSPMSAQELNRILKARGFTPTTRRGVVGYRGFYVAPQTAARPRFVPKHSAASYRRGDRHPAAKSDRAFQNLRRKIERFGPPDLEAPPFDQFHPAALLDEWLLAQPNGPMMVAWLHDEQAGRFHE